MSVERVVIVGRDAALWLTARALRGALEGTGKTLEIVELSSALAPGEAFVASPSLGALHRRLGIDTDAIVRAASGQAIGGQYVRGFGPAPFLLGNEDPVVTAEGIDFGQYWTVERLAGATVPRDRLSPAAAAMARGKVPDGKGPFPAAPGFHLDAATYVAALRSAAGGEARRSATCAPAFNGERLATVVLDDGERIEGDLFVDASGAQANLVGASPTDGWMGRKSIPTRTLSWSSAPPLVPRPPFTDLARTAQGWQARYPLADRTAICTANAESGAPFEAGMRRPWQGNVVVIGEAACRVEPLDQLSLHAAHVGIANLIAWFPASTDMAVERERYNLSVEGHCTQMLDYQQLRYARAGETLPAAVARRVSLFDAIGSVPAMDEDPFDPGQWERALAGLGHVPSSASVQALALPTQQRHGLLASLVTDIDRDAAARPTVAEFAAR